LKALQGPEGGLVIWKVRRNPNFYLKKYWNALFPRGLPWNEFIKKIMLRVHFPTGKVYQWHPVSSRSWWRNRPWSHNYWWERRADPGDHSDIEEFDKLLSLAKDHETNRDVLIDLLEPKVLVPTQATDVMVTEELTL